MQAGSPQQACEKALQAGSKQSGVETAANDEEKRVTQKADAKAKEFLGEKAVGVVGGTVFIAKTISEKKVTFGLPTLGVCDSVKAQVSDKASELKIEWNF